MASRDPYTLSPDEVRRVLAAGGRCVCYEYCVSALFVTLRRTSAVRLLQPGEPPRRGGWPYTLLSLLLGWWGLPWGPVLTPLAVAANLAGGHDVTPEVLASLDATPSPGPAPGPEPAPAA